MKSRLDNIIIDSKNPFKNCKLGRSHTAEILTEVVTSYSDGCILSINGKWGTGKTTFIQMWDKYLQNNGFKTLYYNAWENDFVEEPIISILGEFNKSKIIKKAKKKMGDVITTASKITLNMTPTLVKEFTKEVIKNKVGVDLENLLPEVLESAAKVSEGILVEKIKEYKKQTKTIKAFKTQLQDLVEEITDQKPIVFFIDELDRCNPTFAVKVLERIKHLFNTPRIVFVLSMDKEQLQHSICGYYGSDKFDAQEYLRRFIDLEYNLQTPDVKTFCHYLSDYYMFPKFKEKVPYLTGLYFEARRTPLRVIDRIFSNLRLVLQQFIVYDESDIYIIFPLVILKTLEPDVYFNIQNHYYTLQDFVYAIEESFLSNILEESKDGYLCMALLILSYNLDKDNKPIEQFYTTYKNTDRGVFHFQGPIKLSIKTRYLDTFYLATEINRVIHKDTHHVERGIDYFIRGIDLL